MNVNKIIAKTATSPSTITPLLEQPMPCIREKDRKAAECGGNSRDTDEQRGGRFITRTQVMVACSPKKAKKQGRRLKYDT